MAIHKHRKKFLTKMQADSFYSKIKYDLDMNCDMPWHDRDKWIVDYSGCPTCSCINAEGELAL
jgi:hypothetical protein